VQRGASASLPVEKRNSAGAPIRKDYNMVVQPVVTEKDVHHDKSGDFQTEPVGEPAAAEAHNAPAQPRKSHISYKPV